jgi:hypothetical protein
MKERRRLIVRIIFLFMLFSAMPVSSNSDLTGLAESVAAFWVEEGVKTTSDKRKRCWKGSRGSEIKDASQLFKNIDVGRWLLATPVARPESNYDILYGLSITGLDQRLFNSGYSKTEVSDDVGDGIRQSYVNEALHRIEFSILDPESARSILASKEKMLFSLLIQAFQECKDQSSISIGSIARLAYLLTPYMSDRALGNLVQHLLEDYTSAYEAKATRKWAALSRLSQVVSLLHPGRKAAVVKSISSETRRYLMSDLKSRIEKTIAKRNQSESVLVIKLWRYVALQQALHFDEKILDALAGVEQMSSDPLLQYTLLDTIQLLVLASDSGWLGDLEKSSQIIRAMILYELGTSNTGLRLTRPINDDDMVVTPYPIWLALVPPYIELTNFMIEHSGQLTAEKYKNSRAFSRNQYVSGEIERGFWQLFENVVN